MSDILPKGKEVDFEVVSEPWSRYKLEDGTELRVRAAVLKIHQSLEIGDLGYPNFGVATHNVLSTMVPEELKRDQSKEPAKLPEDLDKELSFDVIEERWQEYRTKTGYTIRVRPTVTKVSRAKKYNQFREPLYFANIQVVVSIAK